MIAYGIAVPLTKPSKCFSTVVFLSPPTSETVLVAKNLIRFFHLVKMQEKNEQPCVFLFCF